MLGLLASFLLAGAAAVSSEGPGCPSGDAVAAELDRLGVTPALAALGSPEVAVEDKTMRVVLRGWDGSVVGAREVVAPDACHERASVAAVFIAAWVGVWSTEPEPDGGRRRAERSGSTAESPGHGTGAPPRVLPPPVSPRPSTSPPTPPTSSPPRASVPSKPTQSGWGPAVEIAGLGFGTHDGNAAALGAGVLAGYRLGKSLAVSALVETVETRQTALGPGSADYRTSRLGVGLCVGHNWSRLFVDAGLFPELTMFTGSGQRLYTSHSATTWGAALDLRGRFGLAIGRFLPFVFAGGSGMLRAERLTLDDSAQSTTLSRWSVSAGVGLAFLLGGTNR